LLKRNIVAIICFQIKKREKLMEIVTVVKATEQEIIELIDQRFGVDFESIVAREELGNQVWVTQVERANKDEVAELTRVIMEEECLMYRTGDFLNILCLEGRIPAGEYLIDCTW
jgi:hypothetical protein